MSHTIGIKPLHFIHVLDLNSNLTHIEEGPVTYVLKAHEKLLNGPLPHIIVPPGSYCEIKDPCSYYARGETPKWKHGQYAIKFHKEPFPLYPGEILEGAEDFLKSGKFENAIRVLPQVRENHAIQLQARSDFMDGNVARKLGDLWQVEGPLTYKPVPEAKILWMQEPKIIKPGQSLRLAATQDTVDQHGRSRVSGEEWLVSKQGAYLPGIFEKVICCEDDITLTAEIALHLRAIENCVDAHGKEHLAGQEWLFTSEHSEIFKPQIKVEQIKQIKKTVLGINKYCVVVNPVDKNGIPQLGKRDLRVGVQSFFLHPGEQLEKGIQSAYILGQDESLVVVATEEHVDASSRSERQPGERWTIKGPGDYIPPVQVKIIDHRKAIPLSKNEGIYVRNLQTGQVRAVMGRQSYLVAANEELWKKQLSTQVDSLLQKGGGHGEEDIRKIAYFEQSVDPSLYKEGHRDKTKVVTYRCPGNTACQIYNYMSKTSRIIFGPDLVILGPHENFNVLSLSAGKPKKPNRLKSLCLMLGPDFITDIIVVETSDHARLQVKLAFNNYFKVNMQNTEKIFAVNDFIGFACKQTASRIRGAVAQIPFDEFHRNSSKVIQYAVLGADANGQINESLEFSANNLVISGIDVQSIEPVDQRMRDSLMKSVQMAIEIATQSIEAAAAHEAKTIEQKAHGELERQKLENEIEAEKQRADLLELQAITAAVESTGQAVAEAQARAESTQIELLNQIACASLKAKSEDILHTAQLYTQSILRDSELNYQKQLNEAEIEMHREMTAIELDRYNKMIATLGPSTLAAIATAGPEMKVKLLSSLGINSMMITDGKSPINLFNTAEGLVSGATK